MCLVHGCFHMVHKNNGARSTIMVFWGVLVLLHYRMAKSTYLAWSNSRYLMLVEEEFWNEFEVPSDGPEVAENHIQWWTVMLTCFKEWWSWFSSIWSLSNGCGDFMQLGCILYTFLMRFGSTGQPTGISLPIFFIQHTSKPSFLKKINPSHLALFL